MREINENEIKSIQEEKWDKKILLSISLRELQTLYDSLGTVSYNDKVEKNKHYNDDNKVPYDVLLDNSLYKDMKNIIKENGGITHDVI